MPDTVYAHVELVSNDNRADDDAHVALLGVSLAVQPDTIPPSSSAVAVACPWSWTSLNWRVLGWNDGAGAWAPITPGPNLNIDVISVSDDDKTAWDAVVTEQYGKIDRVLQKIAPQTGATAPPTPFEIKITNASFHDDLTKDDLSASTKYLSLTLDLAEAGYPLAQLMNLTFFLKIRGLTTPHTRFLVLPSFAIKDASGVTTYDPATISEPTTDKLAIWNPSFQGTKNGADAGLLNMHSEFSGGYAEKWLPAVQRLSDLPVVSGWQTRLFQIFGPYLDVAHLLTDESNEVALVSAYEDNPFPQNSFRIAVLRGIYDLVSATDAIPTHCPQISTTASVVDEQWVANLRNRLGPDFAGMPVLEPNGPGLVPISPSVPDGPVGLEIPSLTSQIADLRRIVRTACSGSLLYDIVKAVNSSVPESYSGGDRAPALLALLQSNLSMGFACELASICNSTQPKGNGQSRLKQISSGLRDFAVNRLQAHFSAAPQNSLLALDTAMADTWAALDQDLHRLVLGTTQPGQRPSLTTECSPLVLPALSLYVEGDGADPRAGVRGISALLRRTDQGASTQWTAPGIAALEGHPELPLLVASRLVLERGTVTGNLFYKNHSFACADILEEYMSGNSVEHSDAASNINIPSYVRQYVTYEGPADTGTAISRRGTAGLRAGSSYEFACFTISGCGALPPELRDRHPARFKISEPPVGSRSFSSYYRTLPVGGLETCKKDGTPLSKDASPLPSLPQNVWPRAAEIENAQIAAVGNAAVATDASTMARPSLLLLTPRSWTRTPSNPVRYPAKFTFALRLPTVDPMTWYITKGWMMQEAPQVLDIAYKQMAARKRVSITDPLIDSIEISLQRWNGTNWSTVDLTCSYKIADLTDKASAMPNVETLPIQVTCNSESSPQPETKGKNKGSITLKVNGQADKIISSLNEGEVYRLEAWLNLDPTLTKTAIPLYETRVRVYQLLIECATAAMPRNSDPDLLSKLKIDLVDRDGLPDQQVRLSIPVTDDLFNIHRIDFLRQNWIWTGRPQPKMNSGSNTTSDFESQPYPIGDTTLLPAWETIEFAERNPSVRTDRTAAFKKGETTSRFELVEDLSSDSRATHLRYGMRVYSRYEGLYGDHDWFVHSTVTNGGLANQWVGQSVRSRVRSLKMPRLKALIPLTESSFNSGCPGILAVFDGPAFDQAGLAEQLKVSFATIRDPVLKNTKPLAQEGPDFLMTKATPLQDPTTQYVPKLVAIGPVGHTLDDTDGRNTHKFSSHSWIIRPSADDQASKDFSWWFAELQFQLEIRPDCSIYPAAQTIQSETVTGSWIQFLPGFQDAGNKADRFDKWRFTTTASPKRAFILLDDGGNNWTPPKSGMHAGAFLLVTRMVFDVAGRKRESYYGIAHNTQGASWTLMDKSGPENGNADFRLRMLSVRTGDTENLNQVDDHIAFWRLLTGSGYQAPTDVQRISPVNLSSAIVPKEAQ